jgi:Gtp-binding protein of the ras superfamily involved in termination of M-phase
MASASSSSSLPSKRIVKIGVFGNSGVGKTSLMWRYVRQAFDPSLPPTLGVNYMQKEVKLGPARLQLAFYDLGGKKDYLAMMPLVCDSAHATLYMFDLSEKQTLNSLKEWFEQVRGFTRAAVPVLVGTKFDRFVEYDSETQLAVAAMARRYANAMRAPLVFCSARSGDNVKQLFTVVLSLVLRLPCKVETQSDIGKAIVEFRNPKAKRKRQQQDNENEKDKEKEKEKDPDEDIRD